MTMSSPDDKREQFGLLAAMVGQRLPLQVCKSAAGFYLATLNAEGEPFTRESQEYWPKRDAAAQALALGRWTQKANL